jgi:hypothetical protein
LVVNADNLDSGVGFEFSTGEEERFEESSWVLELRAGLGHDFKVVSGGKLSYGNE